MSGALNIAVRELLASFGRPQASVILGVFVGLVGLFTLWFDDLLSSGVASMRMPFAWMAVCLLFVVPAVTMGSIAQERRAGTLMLLTSLPLPAGAIVVGKWLSSVAMVALALALTLPWPVALAVFGQPDVGPMAAGYLGLLLAGGTLAAMGVAASCIAETQVVAFLLCLGAGLLPFLAGYALPSLPPSWVHFAQYLTFDYHFSNLASGVLDSRSVVFFGTVTAWFLWVAVHILESRRLS